MTMWWQRPAHPRDEEARRMTCHLPPKVAGSLIAPCGYDMDQRSQPGAAMHSFNAGPHVTCRACLERQLELRL